MTTPLRRKDRAISQAEALDILSSGEYGVLSTVSPAGDPYGVPVSYCMLSGAIYFHCAPEGHKLDNLTANNRVSFCVVGKTEIQPDKFGTKYESAIVFGQASEVFAEEKQAALVGVIEKYSADYAEKGLKYIESDAPKARVFRISIDSITGKSKK
jgi:nitroimidazol reductase NimA-like FMN-containing flavoprotein (pyridoxamine 5'-phosphate oxidase superfamily)